MGKVLFSLKGKGGQLEVYEDFVLIGRKGVVAFLNQGIKGDKKIPISSIGAIQYKKPSLVLNGYIQFSIVGGAECKGGILKAGSDENTVFFEKPQAKTAEEICEYIEKKIVENQKGNTTIIQQNSSADEIAKYKQLLDNGIITQEEFDTKKKQLLGL